MGLGEGRPFLCELVVAGCQGTGPSPGHPQAGINNMQMLDHPEIFLAELWGPPGDLVGKQGRELRWYCCVPWIHAC